MYHGLEITIFDGLPYNRDVHNLQTLATFIVQVEIEIVVEFYLVER